MEKEGTSMSEEKNVICPRTWLRIITPQIQATFLSALLSGLIVHGMGLFNKFSYHDDIIALFWTGTTIPSGRWMLHVVGWMETLLFGDGHFSLPVMNGLFSICCIAASACLLVHMLKIRKRFLCAALGCLMTAFPTVTGLFGYMFTVPYYMLAMLLMTTSAILICSGEKWWLKISGVILGGCSLGIYQAFLPMLLSILLLYDMMIFTEQRQKTSDFLKRIGIQAVCVFGVMVFYLAANRFFLDKYNMDLNGYMGIGQSASTPISVYLERVGRAYREFFRPSRNVNYDMYPMHVHYLYLLMLCTDAVMVIRIIILTAKKDKVRAVLQVVLFALIPLGCNFIFVMSETVHGLMTYGQMMQFVLFVWLLDRTEIRKIRLRQVAAGFAVLVLTLTGIMYARFANQCYLKTTFQQQQAISWYTTLAARIKSTDGFRDDLPVAFLNAEHISDRTLYNIDELDFIKLDSYGDTIESYINSYAWASFMERWCGYGPMYHEENGIRNLPEVRDMPHYPDDGSIRIIQNVIVVNF